METSWLSLIKHCQHWSWDQPNQTSYRCVYLSLPPFQSSPLKIRIHWNMVLDPAPSRTSPGLWWDGLRDLMFCHWFSKALREGGRAAGWLFGPSDSLSRDYWFRLWSEQRRQVFRWDEFWLGARPLSKGNRSRLKEKESLSHATYHMISKGQASNLRIRKESSPTHLRLADKYALLTITEQFTQTKGKSTKRLSECRKSEEMESLIHGKQFKAAVNSTQLKAWSNLHNFCKHCCQ